MADQDTPEDFVGERVALQVRERAEAERWAAAADDRKFRQEMRDIAADLRWAEALPES